MKKSARSARARRWGPSAIRLSMRGLTVGLLGCLAAGGWVVAMERSLSMGVHRESFSDLRFHSYAYLGRHCDALQVDVELASGVITVTNTGDRPLRRLALTAKLFSGADRPVLELSLGDLGPGEAHVVDARHPDLDLDGDFIADLGMILARVVCDQGVATGLDWTSYWS